MLAILRIGGFTDKEVVRVNQWLASMTCSVTRANYRRSTVTIVRACLGPRARVITDQIHPVKQIIAPPVSFTLEEVESLLSSASSFPGDFLRSKCPKGLLLRAFLQGLYETGFRFSDMLSLKKANHRPRRISITVSKTGKSLHKVISQELDDLLRQLGDLSPDESVFTWAVQKRCLRIHMQQLWKKAGLPGSPKWLRRTGATMIEAEQPGMAKVFLGHSPWSHGLAERHYIDESLLPNRCPAPPTVRVCPERSGGSSQGVAGS